MKTMFIRVISLISLSILVFGGREALAQEFSYRVEHDHAIGSCKGELIINQDAVEYRTDNKEHARKWSYADIEMIKLSSPRNLKIITYESVRIGLGRDRTFEFKLLDAELTKELSDFLLRRVERPISTTFVASSNEKIEYAIPARHRHSFGGCQGTLKVSADGVIYESQQRQESSRYWRWSDIKSVSRTGPYQLSITSFEPKFGGPTKTFNFDLKQEMNDALYEYLWARVYRPALPASSDEKGKGSGLSATGSASRVL